MEEGGKGRHTKIDPNSIPALAILIREEQLIVLNKLSEAFKRIAELEKEVARLKRSKTEDKEDHDNIVSSG